MNKKILVAFLSGVLLCASSVYASEKEDPEMQQEMSPEQAKMMEQWHKFMTPGEGHRVLGQLVGKWNHTLQHWMSADSPAEETTGTSEITWIMGGRYIQHTVKGSWNGQPFNGLGIIGYDNIAKEYNTIWLDNMGTGMMQGKGTYNPETNSIGDAGEFSCPMTNNVRNYRSVTTFVDENTYTYETFMTDESGKEFRSMLITYTRS